MVVEAIDEQPVDMEGCQWCRLPLRTQEIRTENTLLGFSNMEIPFLGHLILAPWTRKLRRAQAAVNGNVAGPKSFMHSFLQGFLSCMSSIYTYSRTRGLSARK